MPKIEKILKKQEDGTKKTIYPATICQAIRDGKTGASLEALLSQFNSIYVQYNGTAFDTRNLIPESMRRAGLVITYMNMDSETITERAVSAVQADHNHWGLDVNWTRIDQFTLSGRITISSEGTWLVDGEDTGIKAVGPKGDTGLTPWLKTIDNKLHFSYDNVTWEPCSENIAAWFRWSGNKIQISRDNKTWTDLSGKFADNVHIKGYVANYASLPSGAVQGDVYGVGPTYAAEDTAHTNPIYRYYVRNANSWVDNGAFTSLSAGVVQETGDSETEVMSQKAVSTKLSELGSKADNSLARLYGGNIVDRDIVKKGSILFTKDNIIIGETIKMNFTLLGDTGAIRFVDANGNRIAQFGNDSGGGLGETLQFTAIIPSDFDSAFVTNWYDLKDVKVSIVEGEISKNKKSLDSIQKKVSDLTHATIGDNIDFDFSSAVIDETWKNIVVPYSLKSGHSYRVTLSSSVDDDLSEIGIFARKTPTDSTTQIRLVDYRRTPYSNDISVIEDYGYINLIVARVRSNAVYTLSIADLSEINLPSLERRTDEISENITSLRAEMQNLLGVNEVQFDYTSETIGATWVSKSLPFKLEGGKRYKISLSSNEEGDITEIGVFAKISNSSTSDKLVDFQRAPFVAEITASKDYELIAVQVATVRANAVYTLEITNLSANTIAASSQSIKTLVGGEYDFGDANFVKMLNAEQSETNLRFVKNIGGKFRFSQKVVFPDDVHFTSGEFELFRISKGAASVSVSLYKALSTSKTSDHLTDPICPMPVYNAGLKLYINNSLYYETDTKEPYFRPDGWRRVFMLGEDAMTLRFKGDCSIAANQDIRLKIDDNNIIVYHQANNSIIASYPKSQYETMEALYNHMKNDTLDGALVDFEVKWLSLDNHTPNDLIPCNVALVAEYQRDNNGSITDYDAFPFYFTTKEVNKEYVIDVIFDKDNTSRPIQVLLNGHWIGCGFSTDFYNNDCDFSINNNVGGIITKTITLDHEANPSFPNLREFYYEGINEGLSDTGLLTSEKFVAGTAKHFKENGFSYITMDEMIRYLDGSFKPASNKLYHITIDDSPSMVVLNPSIRETFLRNKIYPSIVWWMKDYDFSEKELTLLRGIESCGFKNGIHAGPLATATSISFLSYDDMVADVDDAIERFVTMFHTYPIFWNNHSGVINYNVSKYLRYKGFSLIQATNGFGGLTTINRYCLPHYFFKDGMDYNGSALSILKSYINYSLDL